MDYITIYLIRDESLLCCCGRYLSHEHVFLVRYAENEITTALVRCKECFHKEMSEEKR